MNNNADFEVRELKDARCIIVSGTTRLMLEELDKILNEIVEDYESRTDIKVEFFDLIIPADAPNGRSLVNWHLVFRMLDRGETRNFDHFFKQSVMAKLPDTIDEQKKASYVRAYQIGAIKWLVLFERPTEAYIDYICRMGD